MILFIAIGFGVMPGVLALGFYTMGFLEKFYTEDIEHVKKGPIEALKSSGASKKTGDRIRYDLSDNSIFYC